MTAKSIEKMTIDLDRFKEWFLSLPKPLRDEVFETLPALFGNDSDYLAAIPGMMESVEAGIAEPLSECVDCIGWNIDDL
ncbi:MAG: hypothetical protein LBT88_03120 [Oscillospiraceae bacterium]|jgi:hypothetical protein|nr:hypothetical protein [Oscillospiraceae bacterium]